MADELPFAEFVRRIRAGDDSAAAELVRRYEPLIRREARMMVEDERLNRAFDSVDVSQSVLGSFFARAASGQYDLESPDQLPRLLIAMARNKLASRARRERCLRRDLRRTTVGIPRVLEQVADRGPQPGEVLSREEILSQVQQSLTTEEHQIIELRNSGLSWQEVAKRLGGSGQARRMQLSRSLERIGRVLRPAE